MRVGHKEPGMVRGLTVALALLLGGFGCTGQMGAPPSNEGVGSLDQELRIVRDFDSQGEQRVVGMLPENEIEAIDDSEVTLPLLLALVHTGSGQVSWPIGERRVIEAALSSREGELGFLDERGAVCYRAPEREPICSDFRALPHGMDVSSRGEVVVVADNGAGSDIWIIDFSRGAAPRQLTHGVGFRSRPIFDSNSEMVAYVGPSEGGVASLFVTDSQGNGVEQLTNVGLRLGDPDSEAGSSLPEGRVPPPRSRASMTWGPEGIRFRTQRSSWIVMPESGEVVEEGAVQ